ncbi:hypothetical protein [Streptomyces sp. NPDC089799]|uniref:hypothetical protein n=1 Tax=Streptomyces sp. NPDC089799 TaxID=3155066 RepID=UPI00341528BF
MKRRLRPIVVAAVSTVALSGCGGSGESGSPLGSGPGQVAAPAGPYRLKMPKAVLKGTFTESDHAEPNQQVASLLSSQIENGVTAFATYRPAGRKSVTDGPVLAVNGVFGTVLGPVTARDGLLQILDNRTTVPDRRTTVITGPRTIFPRGSSEPVSCRIVEKTDRYGTGWDADCSWADGSAVAVVSQLVDYGMAPTQFDLAALAAKTDIIRSEVRVPIT